MVGDMISMEKISFHATSEAMQWKLNNPFRANSKKFAYSSIFGSRQKRYKSLKQSSNQYVQYYGAMTTFKTTTLSGCVMADISIPRNRDIDFGF